ncbi:molecular chaperone DnaJ [Acinetobacter sp. ANC 4470]|uniref:molecular chaperone DnaJ n=1 Tax=Acinetobacter sp. ANC 4470 TaxID=1977881 RepID=UPI000A347342|nr:molecular chaperone DnaJ [Acinetobacter sp. ANC 4470]OTG68372.1 molecular chaperone DnaJ [Acinetobacter sp. ANC 4470]
MSFDLKLSVQQDTQNLSPQQKKLNRLIEQIEQQKIQLAAWQKAQAEIQQQARQTLVPIYTELHDILFQQLEQLWNSLQRYEFSKADIAQLDDKIQNLTAILKSSQVLSEQKRLKVTQIDNFYQQHAEHNQAKKNKKKATVESYDPTETYEQHSNDEQAEINLDSYEYDEQQHEVEREQHRLKRQKQKREQAQKIAEQSLKTVYLKIASIIHPDREQDEQLKVEKTEMLQHANAAYEQQDLFYLLKLQIQVEQNRSMAQKGLSNEQVKFYKLALDAQKQQLDDQIDDIIESLNWTKQTKSKAQKSSNPIHIADMYKKLEADCAELKQQVKWEKERLKYMGKLKGLEMLLGSGVL